MHPKHALAALAVGLLGCSGEPPAPASTSGAVVVTSSAPATSSSASSAPSAASPQPSTSSSHGWRRSSEQGYGFARDISALVAAKAGATPRYLRVELSPGRASVLAVTDKEPTRIRRYAIEGGVVTNVEEPSAVLTRVFADADVAWDKLPARVETAGGLAVVKEVLDVTLLPNDRGPGAMIRFVVDHFRPNQQHTYDEPAK